MKMSVKKKQLMISNVEKAILDRAGMNINMAKNNLSQEEQKLLQALHLIGDRYGVDLTSGENQIDANGNIKPINAEKLPESSNGTKQLLKG